MLDQSAIEGLAGDIYRAAHARPCRPEDPAKLASKLLGSGSVRFVGPEVLRRHNAAVARIGEEWRIYLRSDLDPVTQRFSIAHELAEWFLARHGIDAPEVEHSADAVAAAILVPLRYARAACAARGPRWKQLAMDFSTTESCAALRYGEVTGHPLALITASSIRERGAPLLWPSDDELRSDTPCPGIKKARLRDDPCRLVASAR